MSFLPSALPWRGLLFFPALLVFVGVLLFSTATLAFYVKQTLSFARLRVVFDRRPGVQGSAAAALLGAATPFCTCTAVPLFLGMLEADHSRVSAGPTTFFTSSTPKLIWLPITSR